MEYTPEGRKRHKKQENEQWRLLVNLIKQAQSNYIFEVELKEGIELKVISRKGFFIFLKISSESSAETRAPKYLQKCRN